MALPKTAPSATPAAAAADPELQSKAEELYEKCATAPPDTLWVQRDLSNLQIAEDTPTLLRLIQILTNAHLFKLLTLETSACWKLRTRAEAAKFHNMTRDEATMYAMIEDSQSAGIWSKTIRMKTGLPQNIVTKCLKSMESRGLIQSISNVKQPGRKMYLLADITPSDDISGGSWHVNGELDVALIDAVTYVVTQFVEKATWEKVPAGANRAAVAARRAAIAQKKAAVANGGALRDMEDAFQPPMGRPQIMLVPRDPTNTNFPTTGSILQHVNNSGIIRNLVVREEDMEQLLEMLVLDGRLEKMGATGYRTVKGAKVHDDDRSGSWNGFVDAPCGLCPVFALCGDEGEINARTCQYFAEWLGTE
ncbi:RNA polymerase Rpc34 [Delitschia confertaspora ATCC 74209]|uniref:DNA-directed RNA polymerase III subunit RPC6 n=1 Tax=Delitschia confertaspora ATCC 74209 TaxID=1513339 RepID=A0A9P4MQT0_9PLEO|nr:RNA polymerase Rpc34 [Delitschia confertaspora ATCC 74209]